jgi:antitoxin HigA-1
MKRVHVGEYLKKVYMEPLNISTKGLVDALDVDPSTLSRLLSGKSACSVAMAKRLSRCFTTSVEVWLNLQRDYDLQNENTSLSDVKVLWKGSAEFD